MAQIAAGEPAVDDSRSGDDLDSARTGGSLDRAPWAYRTPRLRALGFDFAIRASDALIGRFLHGLLGAFEEDGETTRWYSFIDTRVAGNDRYEVFRGGALVSATRFPSTALRHLMWDVNRQAVSSARGLLLFHASGVE